jgi:hypothetical protein
MVDNSTTVGANGLGGEGIHEILKKLTPRVSGALSQSLPKLPG